MFFNPIWHLSLVTKHCSIMMICHDNVCCFADSFSGMSVLWVGMHTHDVYYALFFYQYIVLDISPQRRNGSLAVAVAAMMVSIIYFLCCCCLMLCYYIHRYLYMYVYFYFMYLHIILHVCVMYVIESELRVYCVQRVGCFST